MSFDQLFRGWVAGGVAAGKTVKRRLERPSREQADWYNHKAGETKALPSMKLIEDSAIIGVVAAYVFGCTCGNGVVADDVDAIRCQFRQLVSRCKSCLRRFSLIAFCATDTKHQDALIDEREIFVIVFSIPRPMSKD
jgi:hypothetical protein